MKTVIMRWDQILGDLWEICLCVCLWLRPQASKCHRDRDQQKFGSVSDVTPSTPPTPSAGLRGRAWVKCRQSKTHTEGEWEIGQSWNRFLGDEDLNSKRRLRWSGRSSAGEGESAGQHQTSYTWVTHAPYRRTAYVCSYTTYISLSRRLARFRE